MMTLTSSWDSLIYHRRGLAAKSALPEQLFQRSSSTMGRRGSRRVMSSSLLNEDQDQEKDVRVMMMIRWRMVVMVCLQDFVLVLTLTPPKPSSQLSGSGQNFKNGIFTDLSNCSKVELLYSSFIALKIYHEYYYHVQMNIKSIHYQNKLTKLYIYVGIIIAVKHGLRIGWRPKYYISTILTVEKWLF